MDTTKQKINIAYQSNINQLEFQNLQNKGWAKVYINKYNHYYQIQDWIKNYCKGTVYNFHNCYLFENNRDATVFSMRWV